MSDAGNTWEAKQREVEHELLREDVARLVRRVKALRAERDDAVRLLAKLRRDRAFPGVTMGNEWCDHEFSECMFCDDPGCGKQSPTCDDRMRAKELCKGVKP